MLRRSFPATLAVIAGCAVVPVVLLGLFGSVMFMPPMWVHFYGVGVTALVAMAAAVFLMIAGARQKDARTVVVAGGFALMAALLAVHGLMTPGVLVGMNGLISVTGAATLSVGAAVLALSVLSPFASPTAIPRVLAVQAAIAVTIITVSLIGALVPSVVPAVPAPRSTPALLLLAVTLVLYGWLAVRAANTFLLTRRLADLAVVLGLMLLAAATYGALVLTFMDLGWWFGHMFEVLGIALVIAFVAAFPVNRALIARGRGHAVVHAYHGH